MLSRRVESRCLGLVRLWSTVKGLRPCIEIRAGGKREYIPGRGVLEAGPNTGDAITRFDLRNHRDLDLSFLEGVSVLLLLDFYFAVKSSVRLEA